MRASRRPTHRGEGRSARIAGIASRAKPPQEVRDRATPTHLRSRLNELGLIRSSTDRVLTGTAAGLAERLGLDPSLVRVAFLVLVLAGGMGVALYGLAWLLTSEPGETPARPVPSRRSGVRQVLAVACLVLASLLLLRQAGWWLGDWLVWPVALAALGASVLWVRSERGEGTARSAAGSGAPGNPIEAVFSGRVSPFRVVVGGMLIVTGMGTFLAGTSVLTAARTFVFPVLVTVVGLSLIFGPWVWRLGRQLTDERRERIRSQERSEMAAHLHDSVLQTLALIQRSDSTREMSALARTQERELRAWLYEQTGMLGESTLSRAIDALAGRVERMHQVSVEAVVVGDAPLDERLDALVQACGEAMANAARHSGARSVSVYLEVGEEDVVAFVRDQGSGFDVDAVPEDRRGIAESIGGRMERNGGAWSIRSEPGEGTEVRLSTPRGP